RGHEGHLELGRKRRAARAFVASDDRYDFGFAQFPALYVLEEQPRDGATAYDADTHGRSFPIGRFYAHRRKERPAHVNSLPGIRFNPKGRTKMKRWLVACLWAGAASLPLPVTAQQTPVTRDEVRIPSTVGNIIRGQIPANLPPVARVKPGQTVAI